MSSIVRVREFLRPFGLESRIIEFSVSSATVSLAAEALGVEGARIAKTLTFAAPTGCILVVAAGDARIDNRKFRAQFGMKPRMLDAPSVAASTGHEVGGVCPFALPEGCAVHADISMQRFDTGFPACGSANSAIPMTCDELFHIAGCAGWVDVCSNWEV